jgi:hypothetical protein
MLRRAVAHKFEVLNASIKRVISLHPYETVGTFKTSVNFYDLHGATPYSLLPDNLSIQ